MSAGAAGLRPVEGGQGRAFGISLKRKGGLASPGDSQFFP